MVGGVPHSRGMHKAAVHAHVYALTLEVHVLILDSRLAIQVGKFAASIVHEGVIGGVLHGSIDAVRLLTVE